MAKQLNLFSTGQVVSTALHSEMQRSYLEYAMSVIVGRALPDVRDGLKPVHRRILYAMHELGLTPDHPYRKCARVVGDVLGKYHPHGDQAVYDALVRMVQEFSCRYPLLAGHGNFGSVDNDPPAAMRYTETRLAAISHEALLSDISEATVDFIPNFDNSQAEPVVLPAQLPILLLNGCAGIAVGMATNIPPHNIGELVDGLIALIDNPELSDQKLLELIPAPDFPTGGQIVGLEGAKEAYLTGRGSITVRGVATIEEIQPGKGRRGVRSAIVVTELPYQVNKAAWIEKIAELANHGKIEGIADLRDESDRTGMRVVIEVKREVNPEGVLEHLYRQTPLQSNFGAILLALVNGQPRQLALRQLLQEFLHFREQTLTRQYTNELEQVHKRLHTLEGMLTVLEQLDTTIEILRHAPDGTTAKGVLSQRLGLSDRQADAVLAMPMRRLTGMERQNLQQECEELRTRARELEQLLGDRKELLKALKKDLRTLKRKYGDERRTKIINAAVVPAQPVSPTEPTSRKARKTEESATLPNFSTTVSNEPCWVEFTHRGYVRKFSGEPSKGKPSKKMTVEALKERDDFGVQALNTTTQGEIVVFTQSGKAYPVKVQEIPIASSKSKGTPFVNLFPQQNKATPDLVIGHYAEDFENQQMLLLTAQARIKRVAMAEFANLANRGAIAIKLKEDDQLCYTTLTQPDEQLLIATNSGRILRVMVNDEQLPMLGRGAQGYQVLRLRKQERVVGCTSLNPEDSIIIISQLGYAKRMPVNVLRLANRGDIGTQALQFVDKSDGLVGMVPAATGAQIQVLSSEQRLWHIPSEAIKFWGKDGKGDHLLQLNPDERIISVIGY